MAPKRNNKRQRPPNRAMKKPSQTTGRKPDHMPDMHMVAGNAAEFVSRHIEGVFSAPTGERAELIRRALVQAAAASDEQKRQQVAIAYGLTVTHGNDSEAVDLVRVVSNAKKGALPVRVFLGALINYDDGYRPPDKVSSAYSRDVRAIKYAISKGIKPEEFAEKAARPGEGLDVWAKRWSASQRSSKKPPAPGLVEKRDEEMATVRLTLPGEGSVHYSFKLEFAARLNDFLRSLELSGKAAA